jgi:RNA polymerase sigma-70 factor (ECF subfamily)
VLAAFDATFGGEHKIVLARGRASFIDADDFRQACHVKLFTSSPPKIAEYSGQGDLRHWLRVTLMRTLIDLSRARRHLEVPANEERLLEVPGPDHDPELGYLKTHYEGEFRRAFEEAAADLSADDRNVLRAHFMHGLTVDEIGRMLGVHRATAARRVAKARDDLLAGTRRRLMNKLRLDREELDSVLRMIESNVQVSLARVLGTRA